SLSRCSEMVCKNPTLDARPSAHAGWHSRRRRSLKPGSRLQTHYCEKSRGSGSGIFDHRLRHDESEAEKFEYIRQNPVRAGLIREEDEWPYVFPAKGRGGLPEPPAGD